MPSCLAPLALAAALVVAVSAAPGLRPAGYDEAGTPARPPLDKAAEKWVRDTLKRMTLDEKVGQLLLPSIDAVVTSANSARASRTPTALSKRGRITISPGCIDFALSISSTRVTTS